MLGYVSTRVSSVGPLRNQADILQDATVGVKAWYDQFGQQIDGIYFDELIPRRGRTRSLTPCR